MPITRDDINQMKSFENVKDKITDGDLSLINLSPTLVSQIQAYNAAVVSGQAGAFGLHKSDTAWAFIPKIEIGVRVGFSGLASNA